MANLCFVIVIQERVFVLRLENRAPAAINENDVFE
jgi:hypothetical protein